MAHPKQMPLIDHHEVRETFADSVAQVRFDGRNVRINLSSIRMTNGIPPDVQPTGERHVVARLVITTEVAEMLVNFITGLHQQLMASQQGAPADAQKH